MIPPLSSAGFTVKRPVCALTRMATDGSLAVVSHRFQQVSDLADVAYVSDFGSSNHIGDLTQLSNTPEVKE